MNTRILIISEGPPPLGNTAAEGGALRAWGLAKGIAQNRLRVTFAYRSTFKLESYEQHEVPEGIELSVWDGERIDALLDVNQVIVMRYAMGEAKEITSRLKDHHILVSDSYIPISIEVSARNSQDAFEQHNYLRLQESSMVASRRADYILYASPVQKVYYLGYLSGINKLNPTTYRELKDRMFEVPYGVDPAEIPKRRNTAPKTPTLLWYGAFYSWFDMTSLIKSIKQIKEEIKDFKLIIAGAKNPYNKDPGILAHYDKTIKALSELGDTVEFIDWHPYSERFNVYEKASAIITQNHTGLENELAWRTRLMDYILSNRPVLTNGGDPLGEDLIQRGIAFRFDSTNLLPIFREIITNPPNEIAFNDAANRYSWVNITKELSRVLANPIRLNSGEMELKNNLNYTVKLFIKKTLYLPRYIRKNGFKKTILKIKNKVVN